MGILRKVRGLRLTAVVSMIIYNSSEWAGEPAMQVAGDIAETENSCAEGVMGYEGPWHGWCILQSGPAGGMV